MADTDPARRRAPVSTSTITVPEQGQLVTVRERRYVVSEVLESTSPPDPLAPNNGKPQHLVSLSSLDDDALGETLQVIWELEPGAAVHDHMSLPAPTSFDDPTRLDAFLNAVRWGASTTADVRALQSPFRSGIEIEDYQLDPVVRALQMPRVNLLIADDVGLGKTIEAGLVMQELVLRQRVRRVLIVCPAALQIQWRDQMRDKFGLDFRIVDSELMKELRRTSGIHANPWMHHPRLITSMDFLKRDRPMRLMREVLPAEGELAYPRRFDLLIVDEAHNVAPAGIGHYAIDSQRTDAIRSLTPHFEHKLFLTATPHNGYSESFTALLELVDNQRFARGVPPDRELLQAIMVRRLKSELELKWDGTPRFPKRELQAIEVDYTARERQGHAWLQEYTRLRQHGLSDPAERTAAEFVLKLLKKRLFSCPAAFAATLAQHQHTITEAARPRASEWVRKPAAGILRAELDGIEDEYANDDSYEEGMSDGLRKVAPLVHPLGPEEKALLANLQSWADDASARPDSKARALIAWLKQHIKPNGQWSDERVIIFTEYRATQKWLHGLLAANDLATAQRLLTMYGGMPDDQRETIKAAFQASPQDSTVRILLATDAASEGIDLQLHCHRLIHYEIPWNPNRMEQRNGRIDRHGQTKNPLVFHFAPKGFQSAAIDSDLPVGQLDGDLEFLMRAVLKVEAIREDLGKVGPVIADQVTEAMLGRRRTLDTAAAERASEPARRLLKFERDLRAQIQKLSEQLDDTRRSLNILPENIQAVVEIALQLAGQPPLQPATLDGIWPDRHGQRRSCPVFSVPPLHGSWARCSEGLAHPHTGVQRPITFDELIAHGRDDVVWAHLNHPLVQMSMRLLRAEVWSGQHNRRLQRVTARVVSRHVLAEPAIIAYARLVVIGGDKHRLHEEIIVAAGVIHEGRFRQLNVGQVHQALLATSNRQPSADAMSRLQALWPGLAPALIQALDARMKERTASLQSQLAERSRKEASDITTVLSELQRAIEAELRAPEAVQLPLFSSDEQEQYRRNLNALQRRLSQIPIEIEKETESVRARFANPEPRLFPVAVAFLVPEQIDV